MTKINHITTEDVETFYKHPTFDTYQFISQKSAIYPGQGTFLGLLYVNAKLNGEAGEFSENVGKALRDDNVLSFDGENEAFFFGEINRGRREALILELGDVLWYCAAAAKELNISLEDIAIRNLEKLQSRSERNKLQGSGDDR